MESGWETPKMKGRTLRKSKKQSQKESATFVKKSYGEILYSRKMEASSFIQVGDRPPSRFNKNLDEEETSAQRSLDIHILKGNILGPPKMKGHKSMIKKTLAYAEDETSGDGEVLDPPKMKGRTLIQFKDLPYGFFNMTLEEEDRLYGCLKTFGEETLKKRFSRYCFERPGRMDIYRQTTDLVWDGWDAAFIESVTEKRKDKCLQCRVSRVPGKKKPHESKGDNVFPKRPDQPVCQFYMKTGDCKFGGVCRFHHPSERLLPAPCTGDDVLPQWPDQPACQVFLETGDCNVGGSCRFHHPLERLLFAPRAVEKELVVAVLAYIVIMIFWDWPEFEKYFGMTKRKEVVDRLFVAAVKLVLDIFEEEDLERICHQDHIRHEHSTLYNKTLTSQWNYREVISQLKSTHLWEYDIYDVLMQLSLPSAGFSRLKTRSYAMAVAHIYFEKEKLCKKALELMKEHVPLKGHLRAQLLLELARVKCFHVTDTLILKAMYSVDLLGLLDDGNLSEIQTEVLQSLSNAMLKGFNALFIRKAGELFVEEDKYLNLAYNTVAVCTSEAIEVIRLANFERRLQKERVITPQHFWSALLLSRVGDACPLMLAASRGRMGWSSEIFTYELCLLARRLAVEIPRVDGAWGLEYLAFAFFFGPSMRNAAVELTRSNLFERLRSCETQYPVESWKNIDVFMVLRGKRSRYGEYILMCDGYEAISKLREGVQAGRVQLPGDEELRINGSDCHHQQ